MTENALTGDLPSEMEQLVDGGIDMVSSLLGGTTRSLQGRLPPEIQRIDGIVLGELLALTLDGGAPLVTFAGQPGTGALLARTSIDLHGSHVGRSVVLMFEAGDPSLPIVMGVLQGVSWAEPTKPGQIELDVDGQRMVVTAKEQLVLRCGRASITLTKAGKVLIEGSYVLSRSTGVNRIKGGSVQLN